MQTFFPIRSWLLHYLLEIDEYSLHSPFLYDLYINCFKKAKLSDKSLEIEEYRQLALKDSTKIDTGYFGANTNKSLRKISIKKIARYGITSAKYSMLFQRLISYFNFTSILELGTSIGINTLYLAEKNANTRVFTFEGNPSLCAYASNVFGKARASNITLIKGNIEKELPEILETGLHPEFVFFDANHKYEPTIKYFEILNHARTETAVFVFDDIRWSGEMLKAWEIIRMHPDVKIDIDIFRMGILILDRALPRISCRLSY